MNLKDRYGMTALLYACQSAQYLVARKLVASSADVNARDSRGWTVGWVCVGGVSVWVWLVSVGCGISVGVMCVSGVWFLP